MSEFLDRIAIDVGRKMRLEEAIAWVKRCPMANDSEVEIRPVFTYSEEDVSEIAMQS